MTDRALIQQAARTLTRCGALKPLAGGFALPLERKMLWPLNVGGASNYAGNVSFNKEISGETDFELRAISSDQGMTQLLKAKMQIQLPSGRNLFGLNGMDVGQFAYVGSYRYVVDPPEFCPLGSKITVSLTDYGISQELYPTLVLEGVELYPVPGIADHSGIGIPDRIRRTLNQNILAPCWMAGQGISLPEGAEYIVYSTPGQPEDAPATVTVGGPIATTAYLTVDQGYDFYCYRMVFDITYDAGVTAGSVLGRIRTGAGDVKTDGFIDLARYLNGVEFAHTWRIPAADSVYFDVVLEDGAGNGNMYFQAHLEGWRVRL